MEHHPVIRETMHNNQLCPLSVVIATTQPWPEVRYCLDSLLSQARAVGAEIILADGNGQGLPDEPTSSYPEVTWLKVPGASVFYLRALAMTQARGEVIAVTEDHCRVRPDWCERIIEAHKEYPDAVAIGGAVENGATDHLMDWVNFFIGNGAYMLPIQNGESKQICVGANISYKRRVVPPSIPKLGIAEMFHIQSLYNQGEKLVANDRIVVDHVMSLGFRGTCRVHFHNGRSIAGFRLQRMSILEWSLRLSGCLLLPPWLLWLTLGAVYQKRRFLGLALASLPLLTLVVCCHAVGEFTGYIAGPGNSPQQIR